MGPLAWDPHSIWDGTSDVLGADVPWQNPVKLMWGPTCIVRGCGPDVAVWAGADHDDRNHDYGDYNMDDDDYNSDVKFEGDDGDHD